MVKQILGVADIICVIALIFPSLFSFYLAGICAAYLIVKGGIFILGKDIISLFDIVAGVYLIFLIYGIGSWIITVIAVLYLLQKGIASLFF